MNQRDTLEGRLSEALATHHELTREISQHVEQREQLLRVIDELSIRLASTPAHAQELPQQLDALEQRLHVAVQVRCAR